jgi:hypothetical protein
MLRTGYLARVRPWRDAPGDVEIRWYRCPPGARALGVPSLFRSNHWESHPYLWAAGRGEVFNSVTRVFPFRSPPGVTGQHRCGSDQDFAEGGTRNESIPAYPRADDGIAECCRPPLGLLVIDGQGAAAPGRVDVDNSTQFAITNFFGPVATPVGATQDVTVVFADFTLTGTSGLSVPVDPGVRYSIPLACDSAAGNWSVLWWDGGLMFGFVGAGPVNHADTFEGVSPPWVSRLLITQTRPSQPDPVRWQAAPHPIPL